MRPLATASRIAALTILGATLAAAPALAAGSATLRLDPATQTVDQGGTFSVKVIVNATAAMSGVQATVTFDKTKLQLTAATRAAAWDGAAILQPANLATAITAANSAGKFKKIAAAFLPPDAVPTGDQEVLALTFKAIGCGPVTIGLPIGPEDGLVLDGSDATYGATMKGTKGTGATVTIGGCTPAPSASAGASAAPSAGATASPGASAAPTDPAATVTPSDAAPSTTPSDPAMSASPSAAVASATASATASAAPGLDPASSSGSSTPWLVLIVIAVVVLGIAGGLLSRRPKAG